MRNNSNKKDTEIEASEFQNWIASHGGQQKLRALVAYTSQSSTIRRKRSTLSNVSYSSDSSSDDESDYIPISGKTHSIYSLPNVAIEVLK